MDDISLIKAELDLLQIFALETLRYEPHLLTYRIDPYYKRLWDKRQDVMLEILMDAYMQDLTLEINGELFKFRSIPSYYPLEDGFENYLKATIKTEDYSTLNHYIVLHRKWNWYMRKIITYFPR
jgi:hypothetical protein